MRVEQDLRRAHVDYDGRRDSLYFFRAIKEVKGLFEIRIEEGGNIYRIFCCFDEGNLVILFNGFQKKTPKTPKSQIERATRIMNEYFNEKKDKTRQ